MEWLTDPVWIEARGWIVAAGGLFALAVATRTYRMNSREKRESQARKVWVEQSGSSRTELWLRQGDGSFVNLGEDSPRWLDRVWDGSAGDERIKDVTHWAIHNDGDELVDEVQLEVELHRQDGRAAETHRRTRAPLPPGGVATAEVDLWNTHSGDVITWSVLFRDPSGQRWRRRNARPLERLRRRSSTLAALAERIGALSQRAQRRRR